uniref:Uncharacterized protein n=1 Tax=Ditylenchus dipsaci TaxID=166011 RepID=A0A915CUK0_9BILA
MTSPEQQQKENKKKLEDDPYYIPSVPMYCVLGQQLDDTIGDLFFDLHPNSFQRSPLQTKKIVIGDPANMTVKLKPRQSRSLIKPGRPSVAKKLGQAPADEVEEIAVNLKDVQVVDAAACDKFQSPPLVTPVPSVKALASVQPLARDVLEARKLGTPPTENSTVVSRMRLRSSDNKEELKGSSQKKLVTPVKREVSATSSTMQLRSSTKKQACTPEIKRVDKQVTPAKKVVSVKKLIPVEVQPTCAKVLPARRSRSLVKPGRPSVASKVMGPPLVPAAARPSNSLVPVVMKQQVSSEVQIVAEVLNKPALVVKPRNNPNKPSVIRDVFSTKKPMPPPPQSLPIATRSRAVKKGTETLATPLNASGSASVRSETPSMPRSRVSNYMTPTLSSSRRTTDTVLCSGCITAASWLQPIGKYFVSLFVAVLLVSMPKYPDKAGAGAEILRFATLGD